ncbi:LPD29 domain-containing protein [Clostridium sp. E02]|uniref:LPD29 domain-containing protein n=1 Tax=Clostridium sp. E02 TaxID=2487134 RepID=UPI000F529CA0|nr:LPD29 domain-containing protein [Clostridium sp. E02]
MTTYFKNVKNLEDLKNQFKALARKNHPDAGGDPEVMKAINGEYDALFPIWKHKYNTTASEPTKETADSTRSEFYTDFGWKGSRHDWSRSTKEVAALIRAYVKEVYPTYKFSVRFSSASMCSEIHVELKESPHGLFKGIEDLSKEDISNIHRKLRVNNLFNKDSWFDHELKAAILEAWEISDFYKVYNDQTAAVIEDVNREVNSYNFEDCDAQIDYFHVDFYYFGCKVSNDFKIVTKTARIKKKESKLSKASKTPEPAETQVLEQKGGYTYKITKGEDSRDGSGLWLVRITETLDRAAYLEESKAMNDRGGYYSKFRKAFIFRTDPTETLQTA